MKRLALVLIALAILFLVIAPAFAAKFVGVTVSWTIPTVNTDGTPLTDLAGFDIYYGASPSALTHIVQVPNPTQSSYTFTAPFTAPTYFALTSYTTSGTQSAPSNVVEWSPPVTLGKPVQLP